MWLKIIATAPFFFLNTDLTPASWSRSHILAGLRRTGSLSIQKEAETSFTSVIRVDPPVIKEIFKVLF